MKIEIPASKSKETVPSPNIPNPDYPVRVPVQEQRYVVNRKNGSNSIQKTMLDFL